MRTHIERVVDVWCSWTGVAMPPLDLLGYRNVQPLFRNERTLGFSAVRVADEQPVVLKCVTPGSADTRARWLLGYEAQILAPLRIQGVVRTHGIEMTTLGPALVLDDVGRTTLGRPPGEVIPLADFLEVAIRIARIVAELHGCGVCHRDINPRNIVHNLETGGVFLVNFDHATRFTRRTTGAVPLGRLEGTLGYLSPEQSGRMNRSVDRRTDLYSLGATLYELLVGRRLFESADPLEVLYATVALAPRPAHELREDVPGTVSAILARLLCKDPEDRYQNAGALADDLERCRSRLLDAGEVGSFELGTTDLRGTFSLPERLYGRGAATATLEAALRRSREGGSAFVGICGPPGAGKTALSRELLRRLGEGGLMATGVCNGLDHTPYGPILQIISAITASVLDGPRDRKGALRKRLTLAMDGDRALLLRLMPELEPFVGGGGSAYESMPGEGRARILAMFVRLLRAYHEPETPLVLFLDDVQWADPGTLGVLERLLQSDGAGGPLVLIAWRDGELGPNHPLHRILQQRGEPVAVPPRRSVEILALGPLDLRDTAELIADSMRISTDDVAGLAALVQGKTSGNPLFVRELLLSLLADGLLAFDAVTLRWTWSLDVIAGLPPTRNVAELLARLLASMPEAVCYVLGVAACLGKHFEIGLLGRAAQIDAHDLCGRLLAAARAGLVLGPAEVLGLVEMVASGVEGDARVNLFDASGSLRFVHDEVFDAALALVPASERMAVRLRAGRVLLDRWRQEGGSPFAAADHLYAALPLLTEPSERRALAEIHLAAGRHAADSVAFPVALHYLEAGISSLDAGAWQDSHDIAFALHLRAAEAAWMCPEQPRAIDFIAEGMRRTTDVIERIALQRVRIRSCAADYQFGEALRLSLEALSWVGVHLPRRTHRGHVALALFRTNLRVRGIRLATLRALPDNREPHVGAALKLLADSVSVAYASDPLLVPVVLSRMVELMLEHGVSGPAALGCAGWAMLQTQTAGGTSAAITWSAFARELAERFDDRQVAPKVELLVICCVESLTQPVASLAEPLQRAGCAAREAGDAEYTALCAMNHCAVSYLGGVELPEVIRRGQAALEVCRELRQEHATNNTLLTLQAAECMSGGTRDPSVLTGSYVDADALRARLETSGDRSGMALLLVYRAELLVLFGDSAAAVAAVEEATARIGDMTGSPHLPAFHFHSALAWVRQMRETGRVGGRPWREAHRLHEKLAALAEHGPLNFAHKARLVEAELADVGGEVARAQLLYEDAIELARASGMVHEEAICLEWAARAAERFGNRRLCAVLRQDARSAWESWGARAPLSAPGLQTGPAELATDVSSSSLPRLNSSAGQLEFASVLKAARAVSGEINLTELLRTLMQTILENAGATWGMLVLTTDSQLLVAARAEVRDSGSISVFVHDVRVPVAEERAIADALVRDVARTRKAILVHDGATDTRYFSGEGRPPRSVFCLPVRKGTNLVGVMYLENGLARNAFTEARSDVVGVLCSQAAVSIENASLYSDLRAAHDRLALVSRQLVEAQESERRAVARELHDETGQLLTALALHLDLAANEDAGGRRVATIRAARELVGDLIRRVRRISLDLRPVMLDDLGLLPALLWLIDRYTGHTSVRVDLVHAGLDRRFPAAVETAAFRIVQEGLTNVARHAGVGSAAVSVSAGSGNVSIEVTDRGGGFDPLSVPAGTTVGLSGMQERATLLGGRFEVESGPGGTTLVVELPFGESA